MVDYRYNEPYFTLKFSEVDDEEIHVLSFKGCERISDYFKFTIELLTENTSLDSSKILNKKATLIMQRGDEDPVSIHGIISKFSQGGRTPDYVYYSVEFVPRLWRLSLSQQTRVFQQMTVKEIVKTVLEDHAFSSSDFQFDLKESYPQLEYAVQYRESDLDFIHRRLEHFGISYYFKFEDDKEVIVFTDHNDAFQEIRKDPFAYNPNKDPLSTHETITEWLCEEKVVTGKVMLKDYNYRYPEKQLLVESQLDSEAPGTYYEFGDHFKDENEGQFLARIRNEELLSQSKRFRGKCDSRLFHAGFTFALEQFYRDDWNSSEYLITEVQHKGNQRALFGTLPNAATVTPTYECEFETLPIDITYRPDRRTPIPRIPGIMTAKIESSSNDEYAFLDKEGNYRVRSAFDLSDSGTGEASRPVRLTQPYAGADYGLHFPNHANAELIWSCLDGNVDRPMGLGTVPNPSNASPSTDKNRPQNIIRTAAGCELIMDDTVDKAKVSLKTPDGNKIIFDDEADKIEILTTKKHKIVMDDKNKHIFFQTEDGHSFSLDDKNTKMAFQSKNGHNLVLNDKEGSESITVGDKKGENSFTIDISNNKLVINTKNGDIDMHAPNGTIDIQASTFNLQSSGDTTIKSDANIKTEAAADFNLKAGGNMKQEASGDLSQKGMNVTSEASMDHKSKGMNVSAEASMEYKNKGLNVTSEAGVNMQIKGTMITSQGSATNTIKGGVVMIN